jgi:FAD/FMN-containing dehydrogenase
VQRIPEFVERANAMVEGICPGVRPLAFGHFGDGNVHYNITQPAGMAREDFMRRWDDIMRAVHALVVEMGGSISAEHGIGFMKREELLHVKSDVELELMRKIKAAFDPRGILNPGKVL